MQLVRQTKVIICTLLSSLGTEIILSIQTKEIEWSRICLFFYKDYSAVHISPSPTSILKFNLGINRLFIFPRWRSLRLSASCGWMWERTAPPNKSQQPRWASGPGMYPRILKPWMFQRESNPKLQWTPEIKHQATKWWRGVLWDPAQAPLYSCLVFIKTFLYAHDICVSGLHLCLWMHCKSIWRKASAKSMCYNGIDEHHHCWYCMAITFHLYV